ncbi:phage scaffolding protein [Streptomyces sp. LZ34]
MAPITEISVPPWAILGYRADGRPIRPIAGGAEDGEPVAEDDAAPEEQPETQQDDDGWTPPTREEWEAHQAKLKAASGEAAARRKYLKQHGIDPKTGEKIQKDPEPEEEEAPAAKEQQTQGLSQAELKRAVDKAVTETQLTGRRQMRTFAVGFNKALSEAGWNGTRLDSLMKLLDLDDVDIDEGEITGLTEQLETLKSEWPEFFKRTRNPAGSSNGAGSSGQNGVTAAKVDAADKKPPAPEPKSWAEAVARQAVRGG